MNRRRNPFPGLFAFLLLVGSVLVFAAPDWFAPVAAQSGASITASPAATEEAPAAAAARVNPGVSAGYIVLIVGLTLIHAVFAMAETALASLRKSRVDQLVQEDQRGAAALQSLVNDPRRYIATVQVGITLFGFAAAATATYGLAPSLTGPLAALPFLDAGSAETAAVIIVILLVALLTMILGEMAPKSLTVQAPDKWALRLSPFVSFCAVLFAPITWMVVSVSNLLVGPFGARAQFEAPVITKEELEHIIDQGTGKGELDKEEQEILTNVIDFSETRVRSVMTPRIDMTALPVDSTLDTILDTILASGHTRIPIYEDTVDRIIGIVHAKDLLPFFKANEHAVDLRTVIRAAYFVAETKRVSDLLTEFRRSNQQLAIVQDEYAGTEGIVTIEDLLEEIVGDIRDEYDVDEPEVQVLSATESLIDGRMSIDDVNDRLGTNLPHEDYETIGGLVFGLLGHEPMPGERVRYNGMEFLVERIEGRRIKSLRAIKMESADGDEENEATPAAAA